LASTEASKKLEESTKILLDTFNRLSSSANKADLALANFASGNLLGASNASFQEMKKYLGSEVKDANIFDT
jgi:hypothetical protein